MIVQILVLLTCCLDVKTTNQIVSAIKVIENSKHSPYGIESIPLKGKNKKEKEQYARKICFNSVQNNFKRWENAGKPGNFFVFMNKRYCPLDMNWSFNLRSVLSKKGFDFEKIR